MNNRHFTVHTSQRVGNTWNIISLPNLNNNFNESFSMRRDSLMYRAQGLYVEVSEFDPYSDQIFLTVFFNSVTKDH